MLNDLRVNQIIGNPSIALDEDIRELAITSKDFKNLLSWITQSLSVEEIYEATSFVLTKRKD